MAFKFNEYHLGGAGGSGGGGGEAVLTELTVTENGVYDNPTITGGLEPITWDGVVGDRVNVFFDPVSYVKLSDTALSKEDFVGATISMSNGQTFELSDEMVFELGAALLAAEVVVSIPYDNVSVPAGEVNLVFPEKGLYFYANRGDYTQSITFPASDPIPADGWNKVTVNVAGDIVDVSELPTENIEEGKIYRVVKEAKAEILMASNATSSGVGAYGTLADTLTSLTKLPCEIPTHVVDSLPDNMEPVVLGESYGYIPVYVLESTGEPYVNFEGTVMPLVNFGPMGMFVATGLTLGGLIGSVDEIVYPDDGSWAMYILRGQSSTTYGIPNAHPVKRLVDGAWVELA